MAQDDYIVEQTPAHEVEHNFARRPVHDRHDQIERQRHGQTPSHAAGVEGGPILLPLAARRQLGDEDERQQQVVEQLYAKIDGVRGLLEDPGPVERLAVERQHVVQVVVPAVPAGADVRPHAVAPLQPVTLDPVGRHVDAVPVREQIAVPVGVDSHDTGPQGPALGARRHHPLPRREIVRPVVHQQQQHVGEIHHQADSQRHQQVHRPRRISRPAKHGRPAATPLHTTRRTSDSRGRCVR